MLQAVATVLFMVLNLGLLIIHIHVIAAPLRWKIQTVILSARDSNDLSSMDEDGDGYIDEAEFLRAGGTKEQFALLDTNHDNMLDVAELDTITQESGKVSEREIFLRQRLLLGRKKDSRTTNDLTSKMQLETQTPSEINFICQSLTRDLITFANDKSPSFMAPTDELETKAPSEINFSLQDLPSDSTTFADGGNHVSVAPIDEEHSPINVRSMS